MIKGFEKEYYFLSNLFPYKITFNGLTFNNNISAFYAQFFNKNQQLLFINTTPIQADRLYHANIKTANKLSEQEQIEIMTNINKVKFQNKELLEKLLNTNDKKLINLDSNTLFGINYKEEGKNTLGEILMQIREENKPKVNEKKKKKHDKEVVENEQSTDRLETTEES